MALRLWFAFLLLVTAFSPTDAVHLSPPLQLAYLSGEAYLTHCNGLLLVTLGQSPIQTFNFPSVTSCIPPLWSPDGTTLAMATPGLMLLDVKQSKVQTIVGLDEGVLVNTAIWSQQGSYLAWNEHWGDVSIWKLMNKIAGTTEQFPSLSDLQIEPGEIHYWNSRDNQTSLYRSGQQPQTLQLGDTKIACQMPAAFYWENAQMLCSDNDDISLVDTIKHTIIKLTDTLDLQESAPEWSPDGSQILYQVSDSPKRQQWLQIVSIDGSSTRDLTHPSDESYDAAPYWSPDGHYIAFERHFGVKGLTSKIYVIKADGTDLQFIGYGVAPAWRPLPIE